MERKRSMWRSVSTWKDNIEMEKQVLNVSLLNSTGLRQDALTNTMIEVSRTWDNCWPFRGRFISQEGFFPGINYLMLLVWCKFYMTAFEQMIFRILTDVVVSLMCLKYRSLHLTYLLCIITLIYTFRSFSFMRFSPLLWEITSLLHLTFLYLIDPITFDGGDKLQSSFLWNSLYILFLTYRLLFWNQLMSHEIFNFTE